MLSVMSCESSNVERENDWMSFVIETKLNKATLLLFYKKIIYLKLCRKYKIAPVFYINFIRIWQEWIRILHVLKIETEKK